MNIKRLLIAIIVLYFLLWGEAMLFYDVLLADPLADATRVMQSEAAQAAMTWQLIAYAVMVALFCFIFTKNHEGRGIGEGIRYGLLLGGYSATVEFIWATSVGISLATSLLIALIAIVMWVSAGAVLSLIYKPKSAGAKTD
ncbi:MAG: hypothetical protein Kow00104_21410 [Rhodothalassiaceae bacterium]